MLHDVIIEVSFFIFLFTKIISFFFSYSFPWKGTLTLTPGIGVGDHLGSIIPPNHKKSSKNISYENCSHFWYISKNARKHIFKTCSYIQKKTPNPINALKIIIYNTKHINNTKIHLQKIQAFQTNRKYIFSKIVSSK